MFGSRRRLFHRDVETSEERLGGCIRARRLSGHGCIVTDQATRGQSIHHEGFKDRRRIIGTGDLAGVGRDSYLHEATRHRPTAIGYAFQRVLHEVHPDRHGSTAAFFAFTERLRLIEAHPNRGHQGVS
ncbi:MAG: hypothetical protein ACK55I_35130, partial [bacterium]